MFQYACAKALSIKYDVPLYLDTSFLDSNQICKEGFTPRKYELGVFGLRESIAGKDLVSSFKETSIKKKIKKGFNLPYEKVYTQDQNKCAEQLAGVKPPFLLRGYWQSEEYFAGYNREIREAFSFQDEAVLSGLIKELQSVNSISIHFRRGDYVTNPVAEKVLGVLDAAYYKRAIAHMASKVKDPIFYLFSDDIDWVKNNFLIDYKYRIIKPFNADKHWYDMLLMSKCRHHIIANSSFSWWGAWLNDDPKKIVIAPERWFADTALNKTSTQLVPTQWVRL